ncbi:peptidoglycan-associated lipoprotein Pal [Caulobacter sp. UNC279MFTsu5.1]|uniref:peptidoglycan-associated lipoprotein Pal n=1 Tax=Caulobacter sp. UNC279MFTsu5.1 TaxID=1502775 RepID=UPI0008E9D26E|nr:peptidoglycan-associated lipoprotein Pal [Caulobacter sp. UNC279MFTsu5.1]SFI60371.1 peptidoglycan-associated lipoprotein [Caulobacter sp. UNC279MFTsu5.1]
MQKQVLTPALVTLVFAIALSGCASKPKPAPTPATPPLAQQGGEPGNQMPGLEQSPEARSLQQDLAANAGDRVFFALDSHDLSAEARDTLAAQAQWLNQHPGVRVMVAGNCDERGTREYNFALGARRAAAAREFLVAQGVSGGRIATVSYGKEKPIDGGANEQAWARNRNAGTVVIDLAPQ